jgi:arginine decarboxylase
VPGQILHVVLSRNECNEPNRQVGAGIGIALPADSGHHGFVAEHAALDETDDAVEAHSRDLAATMLGTVLGLDMDPGTTWNERAEILHRSGLMASTTSISRVVTSDSAGRWTCVVACCVFLTDGEPQ